MHWLQSLVQSGHDGYYFFSSNCWTWSIDWARYVHGVWINNPSREYPLRCSLCRKWKRGKMSPCAPYVWMRTKREVYCEYSSATITSTSRASTGGSPWVSLILILFLMVFLETPFFFPLLAGTPSCPNPFLISVLPFLHALYSMSIPNSYSLASRWVSIAVVVTGYLSYQFPLIFDGTARKTICAVFIN